MKLRAKDEKVLLSDSRVKNLSYEDDYLVIETECLDITDSSGDIYEAGEYRIRIPFLSAIPQNATIEFYYSYCEITNISREELPEGAYGILHHPMVGYYPSSQTLVVCWGGYDTALKKAVFGQDYIMAALIILEFLQKDQGTHGRGFYIGLERKNG